MEVLIFFVIWCAIALVRYVQKQKESLEEPRSEWGAGDEWKMGTDSFEPDQPASVEQTPTTFAPDPQPPVRHAPPTRQWASMPPVPAPAVPEPLDSARSLIQEAIVRQRQSVDAPAPKAPQPLRPVDAAATIARETLVVSLPDQPSLSDHIRDATMRPVGTTAVIRRKRRLRINLHSRKAIREAIVVREILDRPRAYDT